MVAAAGLYLPVDQSGEGSTSLPKMSDPTDIHWRFDFASPGCKREHCERLSTEYNSCPSVTQCRSGCVKNQNSRPPPRKVDKYSPGLRGVKSQRSGGGTKTGACFPTFTVEWNPSSGAFRLLVEADAVTQEFVLFKWIFSYRPTSSRTKIRCVTQ